MDKRIKLFSALAIAFLLLVTPASAQISLSIVSTQVSVHYDDRYDAAALINQSWAWAQSVMYYARAHGTTPTRSQYSIAVEIALHAGDYIAFGPGAGNPADIGVTEGNWDFLR